MKSAKTDGDVEIGKYPGLASSPAQAFPDCSSDIVMCRLFLTVAGPLRLRGIVDKFFLSAFLTEFQIKSLDAYFLVYSIFMFILIRLV